MCYDDMNRGTGMTIMGDLRLGCCLGRPGWEGGLRWEEGVEERKKGSQKVSTKETHE